MTKFNIGDRVMLVNTIVPIPAGSVGVILDEQAILFDYTVEFSPADIIKSDNFDQEEWADFLDDPKCYVFADEIVAAPAEGTTQEADTPSGEPDLNAGETVEDLLALAAKDSDELESVRYFLAVMSTQFHEAARINEEEGGTVASEIYYQAAGACHAAFHMLDDYITEHSDDEEGASV